MANEQNLITPQELNARLTPEERKANASKAGKKSAEAKRERKTFAEYINAELDKPISEQATMTKREYLAAKLIANLKDDITPKDAKILMEILGELKQKVEVESKGAIAILPETAIEAIQKQTK